MDIKKILHSNIFFILEMLVLAIIVIAAILLGANRWLRAYTHHGEEVVVPNITGLYIEEARMLLENNGLELEIIDSTYIPNAALGTVIEQNPEANLHTKSGRSVYVVANARITPQIVVPDLHDLSMRQAEATLHSLGLDVDSIEFQPSEFGGLVLDVMYEGESVEAAMRLPLGAKLTLVVGQNADEQETVYVPSLQGKTLEQARNIILHNSLVPGAVIQETEDGEADYVVYHQEPAAGKWVTIGSRISLYLSRNPNKKFETTEQEEDFF